MEKDLYYCKKHQMPLFTDGDFWFCLECKKDDPGNKY